MAGGHAPGAAAPTAPRTPGATKPGGPQAPGTKKAGAGTAGGKKTGATTTKKNSKSSKKKREPITIGEKSLAQWGKIAGLTALALIVLGVIVVFTARWLMSLDVVSRWIDKYPGEYAPSPSPDPGFPVWARWQHYVNFFFMLLIIRTGLLVRHQQKPPAVWQSKRGGKKISIFLWLHTSLDILWLANGVVFVVLLFASGHWARLIPTSWKVFPNALSAALQYISFNWPAEHGWENYNSLQQIMYFLVIFVAAPLAVVSGVRMSEWWPKEAQTLNKVYPAPVARHIHYPTMVFFVFFVFVHVLLVFTTGFRENLNHMFAGNDSASWAGFLWFMGGLIIAVAGVMAARPLVLAPIASRFGQVSAR